MPGYSRPPRRMVRHMRGPLQPAPAAAITASRAPGCERGVGLDTITRLHTHTHTLAHRRNQTHVLKQASIHASTTWMHAQTHIRSKHASMHAPHTHIHTHLKSLASMHTRKHEHTDTNTETHTHTHCDTETDIYRVMYTRRHETIRSHAHTHTHILTDKASRTTSNDDDILWVTPAGGDRDPPVGLSTPVCARCYSLSPSKMLSSIAARLPH